MDPTSAACVEHSEVIAGVHWALKAEKTLKVGLTRKNTRIFRTPGFVGSESLKEETYMLLNTWQRSRDINDAAGADKDERDAFQFKFGSRRAPRRMLGFCNIRPILLAVVRKAACGAARVIVAYRDYGRGAVDCAEYVSGHPVRDLCAVPPRTLSGVSVGGSAGYPGESAYERAGSYIAWKTGWAGSVGWVRMPFLFVRYAKRSGAACYRQ
ncbi:hypothetical protein C8J57DRAFT_1224371 [Mycena rebaudengoi]|nr:hypothetical protein C8J57DRAFT_1224371 [Mycena rebaudengoi]